MITRNRRAPIGASSWLDQVEFIGIRGIFCRSGEALPHIALSHSDSFYHFLLIISPASLGGLC